MKKCSTCKIEKPLTDFYPIANGVGGVRPRCKECTRVAEKKKYGENAEFRWSKLSKQAIKLQTDPEHKKKHMLSQRRWHLKKNYGLSLDGFNSILESQGGGCAICGTTSNQLESKTRMVVDHCHRTGKVRGILCDLCNTAIGKFHDRTDLLTAAINYIVQHE